MTLPNEVDVEASFLEMNKLFIAELKEVLRVCIPTLKASTMMKAALQDQMRELLKSKDHKKVLDLINGKLNARKNKATPKVETVNQPIPKTVNTPKADKFYLRFERNEKAVDIECMPHQDFEVVKKKYFTKVGKEYGLVFKFGDFNVTRTTTIRNIPGIKSGSKISVYKKGYAPIPADKFYLRFERNEKVVDVECMPHQDFDGVKQKYFTVVGKEDGLVFKFGDLYVTERTTISEIPGSKLLVVEDDRLRPGQMTCNKEEMLAANDYEEVRKYLVEGANSIRRYPAAGVYIITDRYEVTDETNGGELLTCVKSYGTTVRDDDSLHFRLIEKGFSLKLHKIWMLFHWTEDTYNRVLFKSPEEQAYAYEIIVHRYLDFFSIDDQITPGTSACSYNDYLDKIVKGDKFNKDVWNKLIEKLRAEGIDH